jgi:hypothetical protein
MISRTTCAEADHATRTARYPVHALSVIPYPLPDKLGFRVEIKLRAPFRSQAEILHHASGVGFVESPRAAAPAGTCGAFILQNLLSRSLGPCPEYRDGLRKMLLCAVLKTPGSSFRSREVVQ